MRLRKWREPEGEGFESVSVETRKRMREIRRMKIKEEKERKKLNNMGEVEEML